MDKHGGNVHNMSKNILDLSASINPLGMPEHAIEVIKKSLSKNASALGHYPDSEAVNIRQAIAQRYKLDTKKLMAANGSTELIYLIPRALRPKTVLVTSPTFSEFERSALMAGATIKRLALKKKDSFSINTDEFIKAMAGADMAVLCNPNNPTGTLLDRGSVLRIATHARRLKCVLIIDEAFMDFCPKGSSVLGTDNPYLIVLRSLTKFYALAGLRLGFGYFPPTIHKKVMAVKEPWSLNTLAQLAGIEALKDTAYARKSVALINKERAHMYARLKGMGYAPYPSEANYILIKVKSSAAISRALLNKNIAVRDCGNFKGFAGKTHIRVAVRGRSDNNRFLKAFKEVIL